MPDDKPTVALVELEEGTSAAGRPWRQWKIGRCPICGRRHYHGAGGPEDDPRRYLGPRVPHCVRGVGTLRTYTLKEAP